MKLRTYFYLTALLLPTIIAQAGDYVFSTNDIVNRVESGFGAGRFYYPLLLLFCIYISKKYGHPLIWSRSVALVIIYLILSIFYSSVPYMVVRGLFPALTILLSWSIFASLLVQQQSVSDFITRYLTFMLIYSCIELVFFLFNRTIIVGQLGPIANYIGYFQNPNLFGKTIASAFLLTFFGLINNFLSKKYIYVLFIFLFFVIGSGSRTVVIALGISVLITLLFISKSNYFRKILIITSLLIIIFLSQSFLIDFFAKVDNANNANIMQSGNMVFRLLLWDKLLPEMMKNFWFGAGYNSFWTPELYLTYKIPVAGIHNGYLQVFQDLGIVGVFLLLSINFPFWQSLKTKQILPSLKTFRDSLIALWIFFLIENLTEGDWGLFKSSSWGYLTVLSICYLYYTGKNIKIKKDSNA